MIEDNNNPARYDGDACMRVIEQWPLKEASGNAMGAAMCISSIVRYLWRLERKGDPLAQLDKVQWYLNRLRSYYQFVPKTQKQINRSVSMLEQWCREDALEESEFVDDGNNGDFGEDLLAVGQFYLRNELEPKQTASCRNCMGSGFEGNGLISCRECMGSGIICT